MVRSSREWIPKPVDEKEDKGNIETGDSGDELGDGSVRADESAVEMVVVGDESVDSEACVDVLSRCLWCKRCAGALSSCGESVIPATSDSLGDSTSLFSMIGTLQL